MKRIPDSVVAEIKQANELVSVVEQYLPLQKKSSSNYFGLCPFHSEDTPSFSVNPREQFYYCFGCHKGGDVVSFIKEMEHLDYGQALRYLAERSNISIPEVEDEAFQARKERSTALQKIMLEAARYYYKNLQNPSAIPAQNYIKRRAIPAVNVKRFGLGYAGTAWDGLYKSLRQQKFSEELLLASGLFKKSERGSIYDLFRNRLMFPIISSLGKGRVIGFGGRVLDDSKPKYINSPETEFFTKGRQLYALNLAKTSKYDFFLLVEGYLDAMSAYAAGVDCAVAPLGTALTAEQAKLMKQFKNKVVVCFDADKAGKNAALRSFALLEEAELEVRVLSIPDGKDPDDYVKAHGSEAFKALLEMAVPVFDYRLALAKESASGEGRLNPQQYLNELLLFLPDIKSQALREVYLAKAAQVLGVSLNSLRQDVDKAITQNRTGKPTQTAPPSSNRESTRLTHVLPEAATERARTASPILLKKDAHYKAALTLLFILSKQPHLLREMPQALDAKMLEPLGEGEFSQILTERLNTESLPFAKLYDFIATHHPAADELISDLSALRVTSESLNAVKNQDEGPVLWSSEDALANFKLCRRLAIKKQLSEIYIQLDDPSLSTKERAAKKLLYDLLLKDLGKSNS